MKKVYLLPNVITAFGLSCGLFVIFKMNMTDPGGVTPHILTVTAAILLLAAFADLIDGAIARVIKAESEFGGQFDSMSDAITFGVAPTVVILKSLSITPGTELSFIVAAAAMIYSVCGVLRLVRYNLTTHQIKGNEELIAQHKSNFTGLPIPAAAAAAISANLFLMSEEIQKVMTLDENLRACILSFIMCLIGYFMISRWKFPSLKTLHIRVASFKIVLLTVIFAAIVCYGLLHHFAMMFFCITWAYLILAWTLSIFRVIAGRKSKTLEDFEPDLEDLE